MFSKKKCTTDITSLDNFRNECIEYGYLDKHMLDMLETDLNNAISWYILAMYAQNEKEDKILSDSSLVRLSHKIIENWDSLKHKYKENLTVDMVRKLEYSGEYPKNVDITLKTLKKV